MPLKRRTAAAMTVAVAMIVGACSGDKDDRVTPPDNTGDPSGFEVRARAYLQRAVGQDAEGLSSREKVWRAVAQLATDADRDLSLTVEDLGTITERFATFQDTTDFDMIALLNLWYRSDGGRGLPTGTRDHIRKLILDFKYWYTEPQPEGIIDQRWYWSENHQILFHTIEYLAGQAFPDETFTNNGATGTERMAHARPLIERWIDQRARWGFAEWYSNVYYQEDLEATVALAEFADDDRLATLGSIATDLVLYDLASHTFAGAFGATHGRSYKKDKMTALDEDTWDVSKLVLDDAAEDYQSRFGAVFLASATRYRPPPVLESIVADLGPEPSPDDPGGVVERARHSLELDPLAEITPDPDGPMGLAFDDPDNLMLWWSMAAFTPWQTVVESTSEMTRYNLWDADLFAPFAAFRGIVASSSPEQLRLLARSLAPQINFGLLSEANTYTWRNRCGMLSTAQDFRKGQASQQHHIWQATLSPDAQVFTTHPRTPTEPGAKWHSNSEDWTGNGTLPRSAQFRNVNISIYRPLFAAEADLRGGYQPYTHAYLPQDHFDEVTSAGNWTFARLGEAYVAIWSQRTPRWVSYDPAVYDTNGMTKPFELVAEGGPDNVWITELGCAPSHGTFGEFQAAITSSEPQVDSEGNVSWTSPSLGEMRFGWDEPLVVDGNRIELDGYPRIDSPWAQVPFDSTRYRIRAGERSLEVDVGSATRRVS